MIENREQFLQTIATQLGRQKPKTAKPERNWKHQPQLEVLKGATADELVAILVEQCANIHTTIHVCDQSQLPNTFKEVCEAFGKGTILYSEDARYEELGLTPVLTSRQAIAWSPENGQDTIAIAEQAKIGVVISDLTLAESGTIMLQSSSKRGRSLSFLPENSIAIIPKSSIVPRMTQAAQFLRTQKNVASCINFITGPSNSADIEMNLVVGVHGPIRMTYIVVTDL